LSLEEIATRANVSHERVAELTELGLLETRGGRYAENDVGRVSVIESLVGEGVPAEELAQAARSGAVSFSWFDGVLPPAPVLGE